MHNNKNMMNTETGVPLNAGGTGTVSVAMIWEIGTRLNIHISSTREGRVARAEPAEVRGQEWIEETEDGTTITASTECVICQDIGNLS